MKFPVQVAPRSAIRLAISSIAVNLVGNPRESRSKTYWTITDSSEQVIRLLGTQSHRARLPQYRLRRVDIVRPCSVSETSKLALFEGLDS